MVLDIMAFLLYEGWNLDSPDASDAESEHSILSDYYDSGYSTAASYQSSSENESDLDEEQLVVERENIPPQINIENTPQPIDPNARLNPFTFIRK